MYCIVLLLLNNAEEQLSFRGFKTFALGFFIIFCEERGDRKTCI